MWAKLYATLDYHPAEDIAWGFFALLNGMIEAGIMAAAYSGKFPADPQRRAAAIKEWREYIQANIAIYYGQAAGADEVILLEM
jgi:hypothetical protein